MTDWPERRRRQAALDALDARLAAAPESTGFRFERACLLTELGRTEEAKTAYLDLLVRAPDHAGALNNFGTLLHATGYRTAARTAYAEAAARHPNQPMGHVNLANLLLEAGELDAARMHYETALRLAPAHAEAHQGFGNLLAELGDAEGAALHRRLGFQGRAVTTLPYRGSGRPVPLLLLVSAQGGNVPIRPLLDDRVFLASAIMTEFYDLSLPLPPHALVFNAVGDADLCRPALAAAAKLLARSSAPVVNPPSAVAPTGRADNAKRLAGLPDVIVPRIANLPRSALLASDAPATLAHAGLAFPLLIRSPGFHTGRHFVRVERADDLAAVANGLPGEVLTVIRPLEARGRDGKWRKYRVMFVDGRLYPLHLAVSDHWKVHYFTADMADKPSHRAEEAAFLTDMPGVIGRRGMAALEAVRDALGLDYAGIDFALGDEGQILLFEANATMVVNPPEPDECWAYRRPAVARIHDAVRAMLLGRAQPA